MLRIIGWILKTAIFAGLVLVMGNVIRWHGKTVSDQVKTQIAQAQRSDILENVKDWAGNITKSKRSQSEEISPSERQKLKALIRELNTTDKN